MTYLIDRTDYIPDAINRHFVISFWGLFWVFSGGCARYHLYEVQFVPLRICTVWLHRSSLTNKSLHGSLKNKASQSSSVCVVVFLPS